MKLFQALTERLRGLAPQSATARFLQRGSAVSVLLKISSSALSFLTGILLARVLGPAEYGVYAYVMALVTLTVMPATLGAPQLLVRQVAAYHYRQQWGQMRGLLRWTNLLSGLLCLALLLLGAMAISWWLNHNRDFDPWVLWLALPLLPLLALASLRVAALQGLHHVIYAQLPEGLLRPGLFLLVCGLLYLLLGGSFDVRWAMTVQLATTALAFAVGALLLWRLRPPALRGASPETRPREWWRSMLPLLFISGVYVVNSHVDLIMLGYFRSAEEVGIYRVATRGAEFVMFFLMAADMTAAPVFSRLFQQPGSRELQRMVTLVARMVLLCATPIALLLIFFGESILGLLFGQVYTAGALALAFLAAGQWVNAGTGSASTLMMMTGHERSNARVAAVGVVANVLLNFLLIPRYGINGAAAATASTIALVNLMLALAARRVLRIDSTALGRPPVAESEA